MAVGFVSYNDESKKYPLPAINGVSHPFSGIFHLLRPFPTYESVVRLENGGMPADDPLRLLRVEEEGRGDGRRGRDGTSPEGGEEAGGREQNHPGVQREGGQSGAGEEAVRLWGPVQKERAEELGALAASCSVLLKPLQLPAETLRNMQQLVPNDILPAMSDTAASLCARLKSSTFLHPTWYLKSKVGHSRHIKVNETSYPQPRRVRWSKVAIPEHIDEDGDRVVGLLGYPHIYSRSKADVTCEVMPQALNDLISHLYPLALPFLAPNSCKTPPNACELNLYYTAFASKIGRHRDHYTTRDLENYLGAGVDPSLGVSRGVQAAHTSVMVWTMGNSSITFLPHILLYVGTLVAF